jgi:murein DD-endopeptidase MepM/ murein hydrolase activator NlpD
MLQKLKQLFLFLLKEKTAWPAVFILSVSLVNLLVDKGFFTSENKLQLTTVRASASPAKNSAAINQSALKNSDPELITLEEKTKAIYNKFLNNNFIIPTTGINWGVLHGKNGVDIADQCGKKVYAAEEGLVIELITGDWNDGYGNSVIIEHPNGIKTKYAHLKKVLSEKNNYILQGDLVGLIGNTGLTQGATGCHLHFEVLGAENPFVL